MANEDQLSLGDRALEEAHRLGFRRLRVEIYRNWILTVFCWDGLLPIVVIAVPMSLKFLLPRWPVLAGIAGILVPVIALGIRVVVGFVRLASGHAYRWQFVLFIFGISALFLVEMFWLNDQVVPGPKIGDRTLLLEMLAFYLTMMTIALFPARALRNLKARSQEMAKHFEMLR